MKKSLAIFILGAFFFASFSFAEERWEELSGTEALRVYMEIQQQISVQNEEGWNQIVLSVKRLIDDKKMLFKIEGGLSKGCTYKGLYTITIGGTLVEPKDAPPYYEYQAVKKTEF